MTVKLHSMETRGRRKGAIAYIVPLVIIVVLIIAFVAGYFAGTGGTTSTVVSTVTNTGAMVLSPTCVALHNCPSSYVYLQYGASQASSGPGFNPSVITVIIGVNNTITFENLDTVSQTIVGANNLFSSGVLAPGASYTYTFSTVGTFTYSSPTYSWEKGTVNVVQSTASTSAPGSNPDDNY